MAQDELESHSIRLRGGKFSRLVRAVRSTGEGAPKHQPRDVWLSYDVDTMRALEAAGMMTVLLHASGWLHGAEITITSNGEPVK